MNIRFLCYFSGFILTFFILSSCGHSQSSYLNGKINDLLTKLKTQSQRASAYQSLHDLIVTDYNSLADHQRQEIKAILKTYTTQYQAFIASKNEPGQKISIQGKVTDTKGKPIPDVLFTIYQTDCKGYYTPNDSINKTMGERDSRLFGYLRTDQSGHFEIQTVRPNNYPIKYEGRYLPHHIHIDAEVNGYKNLKLQVVFKDDPAMNDHWRAGAAKLHFPIVNLIYDKKGTYGICNITMESK